MHGVSNNMEARRVNPYLLNFSNTILVQLQTPLRKMNCFIFFECFRIKYNNKWQRMAMVMVLMIMMATISALAWVDVCECAACMCQGEKESESEYSCGMMVWNKIVKISDLIKSLSLFLAI